MSKNKESINIMKRVVIDVLILIVLAIFIEATSTVWLPFQRGFFCEDDSIRYPYRPDTVTVVMLRTMQIIPPFIAFLICEWNILRKETTVQHCLGVPIPTWVRGFYTTGVSFSIGCCFLELAVNIAKDTIGRLRPHFLDICQPSINCSLPEMKGRYIMPHEYTCTGSQTEQIDDAHKSFPSGHSACAAYSMFYLAFYLGSRLKCSGSNSLRHLLQFIAVMLSWYCALSRVSDYKHHWSDVTVGYLIGIAFAVIMWIWGTELVQKQKIPTTTQSNQDISISTQQVPTQNGLNSSL